MDLNALLKNIESLNLQNKNSSAPKKPVGKRVFITKGAYRGYIATIKDEDSANYLVLTNANRSVQFKRIKKENVEFLK